MGNGSMTDRKALLVLGIDFLVVLVFVTGVGRASGPMRTLYHSYFADIAIPFTLYFLLSLNERQHAFLKQWWVKALAVFVLCATSEILQFFSVFALARVFDPLDFVMYASGVLLAASLDRAVFAKWLSFWE